MLSVIKKVLYAGIGAMALSEEKSREIIAELVKQGEITAQDGEKLIGELKNKCAATGKSFEEKLIAGAKEYLRIKELEDRVAKLENEIAELKK